MMKVLIALALLMSTCHAAQLRGSPDVVLASMKYVVKDSDSQIDATEKDFERKKDDFKTRVVEEKNVMEKTKKVMEIATDCVKSATAKKKDAELQADTFTKKLIPAKKIEFTRNALAAAEDAEAKASKEFKAEEAVFHRDMSHLEAVKNESTRIMAMLNGHYTNKQQIEQGGGVVKPETELKDGDTLDDLIPNPIRGHINIGMKTTKKEQVKKEQKKQAVKTAKAPAVVRNKKPAKTLPVPKAEANNVVTLLQMAQHNGLGEYADLISHLTNKPTAEAKKRATTKVPYQHPEKNSPKFHARTASTDAEVKSEDELSPDSKAEAGRVHDKEAVKREDGAEMKATDKEVSSGKLKLTALGKKVNVGKDVGGHVMAAMAKLHGFISDHSNNRETAFNVATKSIRKEISHSRSEVQRLTALIHDMTKTNAEVQKNIDDFKELAKQNQMQIDQCKLDQERAKVGELDANTKIGHILGDLKKLTSSYKHIVGDFKNEKSTAQYVMKMVQAKLVKLRKFLDSAKKKADAKKKAVAEKFVDPDLPKYKGLKDALACDPNASPEEWCKTPEMMVRCGVTKESCDTYHFQTLAMPPHKIPEGTKSDKHTWQTTTYKDYKDGATTVDARTEAEVKRDLTPDDYIQGGASKRSYVAKRL